MEHGHLRLETHFGWEHLSTNIEIINYAHRSPVAPLASKWACGSERVLVHLFLSPRCLWKRVQRMRLSRARRGIDVSLLEVVDAGVLPKADLVGEVAAIGVGDRHGAIVRIGARNKKRCRLPRCAKCQKGGAARAIASGSYKAAGIGRQLSCAVLRRHHAVGRQLSLYYCHRLHRQGMASIGAAGGRWWEVPGGRHGVSASVPSRAIGRQLSRAGVNWRRNGFNRGSGRALVGGTRLQA